MFLDRVRVLDLTDERGLLAGRILADLGADVVQVEPPSGSTARGRLPRPEGDGSTSYVWEAYAANKRGVVADPETPAGQQLVRALAAAADVLVENEGPAVQRPRGLDADDLRRINPRLVYVSITPFGRSGPKSGYAAADLTLWAAGGPLDEHRDGDRPPVRISLPQAWLHAAADAAAGAQLALLARGSSGRGQLVDVSVQASLGAATLGHVLAHAVGDQPRDPDAGATLPAGRIDQSGSGAATDPALKKWRCSDGIVEFHLGIGAAAGAFTNNLLRWMAGEGAVLGRFAALDFRKLPKAIEAGEFTHEDTRELRSLIAGFFAGRTKDEILDAAVGHKLLCVPIFTTTDIQESKQLADRNFFVQTGHGDRRRILPGPFARVTGAPGLALRRPAPRQGEHTGEVLAEWRPAGPVRTNTVRPARQPLAGLKVLDFSWVVAGPMVGRALADFGATVVRVESSTKVETARYMQPFVNGVPSREGSALYGTWNAGKLGVTLDLQTGEGRAVAHDLAGWADTVVESFSPGQMARWGLDYATLARDRPDLIMLSTSLNGQTGPLAKLAGFGNIGAALSGFQAIAGWPDRPMFGPFGPYTDYVAPRFSLCALLAAVEYRTRTGAGCYLDVAQVEAGVWFQAPEIADNADNGTVVERLGNADREFAPHGVYPTAVRSRFVAVAVTSDSEWRSLARAMGRHDLFDRADLATASGRRACARELDGAVAEWTLRRTAEEVETALQQVGVPAHVSASSKDFCLDAQLLHRGHLISLPHPRFGRTVVEGPRYLLSETPGAVTAPAPAFGQHNHQVLADLLGYDSERIDRLEKSGVLR
ncbi:CaiB/BaiF CoA-transferase family protein [Amycolatopsis benzoatilytica]|uniref:CaiB/BaiF CoA-transferase family protein n=1 Tax=Amycolatopsis benzoatilytica TaxID=346045 RepID=UPI00036B1661|nr:CoA transferase [Amycolatopsis benzoatilytica]